MGFTLGHGAWQIDQPSNGSIWNSYSFQPVGQWMGYSFTDLGAEGCCRSLNALFSFGYCCLCLCVCINHGLVRAITHHSFNLESPNLEYRCKRPRLRLWGDRPWPPRSNLTWKLNFTSFWACPHNNFSPVQARITKFGPEMHLSTIKIPYVFGVDQLWPSRSNII